MKRLVLCAVVLAASVSLAQAQVCSPDTEFCPDEDEVGAEFGADGSINVFTPFYPTDPVAPWVRIVPPNPIIGGPLVPPNPIQVRQGVQR